MTAAYTTKVFALKAIDELIISSRSHGAKCSQQDELKLHDIKVDDESMTKSLKLILMSSYG